VTTWQKWAAGLGVAAASITGLGSVYGGLEWMVMSKRRLDSIPRLVEDATYCKARWAEQDRLWGPENDERRRAIGEAGQ
jgi:hypothetical protein